MGNKPNKPVRLPVKEQREQILRAIAVKRENLFNGLLFSIVSNPSLTKTATDLQEAVDLANGLSEIAIKKLFALPGDGEDKKEDE